MGARGPLAKPDNVRYLTGNPGKRGAPKTVKAKPAAPKPPSWLDREAVAEWKRIVPELDELGLVSSIDRATLARYCDWWSRYVHLRKEAKPYLVASKDPRHGDRKNPAWQLLREAEEMVRALSKEIFATPVTRLRANLPEGDDDDGNPGVFD